MATNKEKLIQIIQQYAPAKSIFIDSSNLLNFSGALFLQIAEFNWGSNSHLGGVLSESEFLETGKKLRQQNKCLFSLLSKQDGNLLHICAASDIRFYYHKIQLEKAENFHLYELARLICNEAQQSLPLKERQVILPALF